MSDFPSKAFLDVIEAQRHAFEPVASIVGQLTAGHFDRFGLILKSSQISEQAQAMADAIASRRAVIDEALLSIGPVLDALRVSDEMLLALQPLHGLKLSTALEKQIGDLRGVVLPGPVYSTLSDSMEWPELAQALNHGADQDLTIGEVADRMRGDSPRTPGQVLEVQLFILNILVSIVIQAVFSGGLSDDDHLRLEALVHSANAEATKKDAGRPHGLVKKATHLRAKPHRDSQEILVLSPRVEVEVLGFPRGGSRSGCSRPRPRWAGSSRMHWGGPQSESSCAPI